MIELAHDQLQKVAGVGVAGNFAGHLDQAGEAGDFAAVDAPEAAPKGIFPWFLPGESGFLGAFPLSPDELRLPDGHAEVNLQIEPEAGVVFDVTWQEGRVASLTPVAVGAFNDCSIRRPGARKISEKKNWGPSSKGFARRLFAAADIERDGATRDLRLASFLRRGEQVHEYGIDSPVVGYSYYGATLTDWILDRLARQRGGETPLEDVGAQLIGCGRPTRLLVGIGATRYTEFGATNFLEPGDESIVVLYDGTACARAELLAAVKSGREAELDAASVLTQRVN